MLVILGDAPSLNVKKKTDSLLNSAPDGNVPNNFDFALSPQNRRTNKRNDRAYVYPYLPFSFIDIVDVVLFCGWSDIITRNVWAKTYIQVLVLE